MQNRISYVLAAAAFVGAAATGQAQQRIPVTKDRPTTPDTVTRVDTVTRYIRDTVTVYRRDTVTVTQSTGIIATETPMVKLPPSWYFQLGGGVNLPQSTLGDVFSKGYNVTASLGWQPVNSVFGLRFDGAYDRLNGDEDNGFNSDSHASVWSGLAEATLNAPIGNRTNGSGFYLIGGGGIHHFTGLDNFSTASVGTATGTSANVFTNANGGSSTDWGVNGGAGLRFGWGRAALFAESRYFHVFTEGEKSQWVPIIAGVTFR